MPPEATATIVVALLALAGSIFTSVMQYRNKMSAAAKAEIDRLQKEKDDAETKLEKEKLEKTFTEMKQSLDTMQQNIDKVDRRVEKITLKIDARLQATDDTIVKLTEVLSRNARMYSSMMHVHTENGERIRRLAQFEQYNMQFTKDTAGAIIQIGEIMTKGLPDNEDTRALKKLLDNAQTSQNQFVDKVMNTQMGSLVETPQAPDSVSVPTVSETESIAMNLQQTLSKQKPQSLHDEFHQ